MQTSCPKNHRSPWPLFAVSFSVGNRTHQSLCLIMAFPSLSRKINENHHLLSTTCVLFFVVSPTLNQTKPNFEFPWIWRWQGTFRNLLDYKSTAWILSHDLGCWVFSWIIHLERSSQRDNPARWCYPKSPSQHFEWVWVECRADFKMDHFMHFSKYPHIGTRLVIPYCFEINSLFVVWICLFVSFRHLPHSKALYSPFFLIDVQR